MDDIFSFYPLFLHKGGQIILKYHSYKKEIIKGLPYNLFLVYSIKSLSYRINPPIISCTE